MATQKRITATPEDAPSLQTIAFTAAQAERVAELQEAFVAAQGELQKFVNYLAKEYRPDESRSWALTATGFVETPPQGS